MKKAATKHKTRLLKKRLSTAPRKSWLRIYSHVAYIISAINLFLFPARANVQAAPPDLRRALVCVQPCQPLPSETYGQALVDFPTKKAAVAQVNIVDQAALSLTCAIDVISASN